MKQSTYKLFLIKIIKVFIVSLSIFIYSSAKAQENTSAFYMPYPDPKLVNPSIIKHGDYVNKSTFWHRTFKLGYLTYYHPNDKIQWRFILSVPRNKTNPKIVKHIINKNCNAGVIISDDPDNRETLLEATLIGNTKTEENKLKTIKLESVKFDPDTSTLSIICHIVVKDLWDDL